MPMSITDLARKQMNFIGDANSWHAPLNNLLDDTSPDEAVWRSRDGGHTIYEIANHLAYCLEEVTTRLQGNPGQWDESRNWVQNPELLTAVAWHEVLARLRMAREQLLAAVESLGDDKLLSPRGEQPPLADTVFQLIHHEAFHTGQIALIRRQLGKQALI